VELPPEPGADIVVEIGIPAGAPGTDLTRRRAVYWELEITGRNALGKFERRELVPIYAVPGARCPGSLETKQLAPHQP
jgi:hypothetical protein